MKEIKELLEKLKQCDDFHNRCDFLMEHSEITYMLDYITKLQQENKQLKEHIEKYEHYCKTTGIEELMKEKQKYKEVIDKAIEYMKDFIFEPLLTNEDRKLIMYNDNLRNFEKILKEVSE